MGEVAPHDDVEVRGTAGSRAPVGAVSLAAINATRVRAQSAVPAGRGRTWLVSTVDVTRGAALLTHFLSHYVRRGVRGERMLFVVHVRERDDGDRAAAMRLARVLHLIDAHGAHALLWRGPFTALANWFHQTHLANLVSRDDWLVWVDADEFIPLDDALCEMCADASHVTGQLVDRVAADGHLHRVRADAPLDAQFPLRCNLTASIGANPRKIPLTKGFVRTVAGHHDVARYESFRLLPPPCSNFEKILFGVESSARLPCATSVMVQHFKWTAGVVDSLRDRQQRYHRFGDPVHRESAAVLSMIQSGELPLNLCTAAAAA